MRRILALVVVGFMALAAQAAVEPAVKNVILFIGDGMGDGQVSTAMTVLGTSEELVIPGAQFTGLMSTIPADALVTDSAASGTALATGYRTNCGVVGQLPNGARVENVLEAAHLAGKAAGVVTTSGLADATPATFTVHALYRHRYNEILRKQLATPFEVRIGGDFSQYHRAIRTPGYLQTLDHAGDLVAEGTTVVRTVEGLKAAAAPLVALLPPRPRMPEQHGPALAAMTSKALELLSADPEGFVVMIETEVTDEAGHENDLEGVVGGVAELDAAVRVALEFANNTPGTLVLVTADHDTGGLGIVGGTGADDLKVSWASSRHTAQWVPVFAWGPEAARFTGVFRNADLARKIGDVLGLEDFPRVLPN